MFSDNPKKEKNEKPEKKDTRVRVSEIIDFGQKISNDWLEEEAKRKTQIKQGRKRTEESSDEEPNPYKEESEDKDKNLRHHFI